MFQTLYHCGASAFKTQVPCMGNAYMSGLSITIVQVKVYELVFVVNWRDNKYLK